MYGEMHKIPYFLIMRTFILYLHESFTLSPSSDTGLFALFEPKVSLYSVIIQKDFQKINPLWKMFCTFR